MGYRINMDSECVVCGKMTEYFCDGCECYICENHRYGDDKLNSYMFCKKCKEKNKKSKVVKKGNMHKMDVL